MALGVSSQSHDEQSITASALGVGQLLCDSDRLLAHELGLPTFTVDNIGWYCRLMLVVDDSVIARAFYPVTSATRIPAQAVAWMRRQQWSHQAERSRLLGAGSSAPADGAGTFSVRRRCCL